jgi:hypothetical protein
MLKRIWQAIFGSREQSPEELQAQLQADADRAEAKDAWLADEARQSRQSTNIGG